MNVTALRTAKALVFTALLLPATHALAFQMGGMGGGGMTAKPEAARPPFPGVDAILGNLRDLQRLGDAELLATNLAAFKAAEAQAKKRYEAGQTTVKEYLEAQYLRVQTERLMAVRRLALSPTDGEMGGIGSADPPAPRPRKPHPADLERNKAIELKLEKVVRMTFAPDTPLEDVIKYIKEETKDPNGKVVPIYVDPVGLQEAEKTMASPVTIDLEGVPLRTTLRLLLEQLNLDYRVRDGLILISGAATLEEEELEAAMGERRKVAGANKARQAGGPGMGGGFQ